MLEIFGVKIDELTDGELENRLREWLNGNRSRVIVTPNAEMILAAHEDEKFKQILNQADLALPDTVSLRFAASAYGHKNLPRHTGVDTLILLARLSRELGKKFVLYGGDPGSAQKTADIWREKFPGLDVMAIYPGEFDCVGSTSQFGNEYIERLAAYKPEVLAVALGHGKQELFIEQAIQRIPSIRVAIGIGGALEMHAGVLPRAPLRMQQTGFEWLWRLWLEPSRAKRIYDATMRFPVLVIRDTLERGVFIQACKNVLPEIIRQLMGK